MTKRILIGCEESGTVRDAFARAGWDAWSCDILPSRKPGNHIQADILTVLDDGWDMAVFHTPCTYLANSGIRWLYNGGKKENGINRERWNLMERDAELFLKCWTSKIPRKAMENPFPHPYALAIIGKYSQIIQPWMFGHPETKETCLWLNNLPPLQTTNDVRGVMNNLSDREKHRIHHMAPGPNRQRDRSVTYSGIADAMVLFWGKCFDV